MKGNVILNKKIAPKWLRLKTISGKSRKNQVLVILGAIFWFKITYTFISGDCREEKKLTPKIFLIACLSTKKKTKTKA